MQEGWLAEYAAEEQDGTLDAPNAATNETAADPMQGLEGLDVAGPKPV